MKREKYTYSNEERAAREENGGKIGAKGSGRRKEKEMCSPAAWPKEVGYSPAPFTTLANSPLTLPYQPISPKHSLGSNEIHWPR